MSKIMKCSLYIRYSKINVLEQQKSGVNDHTTWAEPHFIKFTSS
jgi:hypothetical protein